MSEGCILKFCPILPLVSPLEGKVLFACILLLMVHFISNSSVFCLVFVFYGNTTKVLLCLWLSQITSKRLSLPVLRKQKAALCPSVLRTGAAMSER